MASKVNKGGRQGSAEKVISIPHTRINDERQMEEIYQLKGLLGEGNFGVVHEVVHRATSERWASKAINKEKAGSSRLTLLEREVALLKRVRHEHIICLKEVFETSQKVYLVMELCLGGELSKYVQKHGPMDEASVKQVMSRLASAIAYLHKNDMVHRDLKLENILLKPNPDNSADKFFIKVTDFGLSTVKGVGHENMMMDFCGTPLYMAPEILENKTYGVLCDVWAMGIIMFWLVTGGPPFHSLSDEVLFNMIRSAEVPKIVNEDVHWQKFSKEANDMIVRMLDKNTEHRLSASEVLHHSWITGQVSKEGPRNVLELMKEFHSAMNGADDDSTDNMDENKNDSAIATANTSHNNNSEKKSGSSSTRTTPTPTPKAKKLIRNTTDPNLLQTAKDFQRVGGKSLAANRSAASKSKSPPTRDGGIHMGSRLSSRGAQNHGMKPTATHTCVTNTSAITTTSNSSSRISSTQSTDHNHKPKKKSR